MNKRFLWAAMIGGLVLTLALFLGGCPIEADSESNSDTTVPGEVSGLGSSTAAGSVTLSWTDPSDEDLDHIEITFSPEAAGISQPVVVPKRTQSKTINGLTDNTQYAFIVQTVDTSGNKSSGIQKRRTAGLASEGDFENVAFRYAEPITLKFYSLVKGVEIDASKSNTTEWDIAIEAKNGGFCYIYTNSGASAARFGSEGQGGVWFTGKTNFDDVALADRVTDFSGENAEYADYVTDVTRYQIGMGTAVPGEMNIMTYYGYASGDGLSETTAFGWSNPGPPMSPFYEFNKKAFANCPGGMPPPWQATGQVYIIKHADEDSYSKFQVNALSLNASSAPVNPASFIVSFKFKGFAGE
jgi:hypothetical protein